MKSAGFVDENLILPFPSTIRADFVDGFFFWLLKTLWKNLEKSVRKWKTFTIFAISVKV